MKEDRKPKIDISNLKFGKLFVIKFHGRKNGRGYWLCRCDCGNKKIIEGTNLKSGKSTTCGCSTIKDLTGLKFGRLTAIRKAPSKKNYSYWLCRCDCGNEKQILTASLLNGQTQSCGCLAKELSSKRNSKYGNKSKGIYRKLYSTWKGMLSRCYNVKDKYYKNYGQRGIHVCDKWIEDYNSFYDDMNESFIKHLKIYGKTNTTLERINVNDGYSKNNCTWATQLQQAGNKSNNRWFKAISPNGDIFESKNQQEFSRQHNLNVSHINACLRGRRSHHKHWIFTYIDPPNEG